MTIDFHNSLQLFFFEKVNSLKGSIESWTRDPWFGAGLPSLLNSAFANQFLYIHCCPPVRHYRRSGRSHISRSHWFSKGSRWLTCKQIYGLGAIHTKLQQSDEPANAHPVHKRTILSPTNTAFWKPPHKQSCWFAKYCIIRNYNHHWSIRISKFKTPLLFGTAVYTMNIDSAVQGND